MGQSDAAPAAPRAYVVYIYPDVRETPARTPFPSVARLRQAEATHPNIKIHTVPATSLRTFVPLIANTPPFPGAISKMTTGQSFPLRDLADTVVATGQMPLVREGTIFGMNSTGPKGLHNTQGIVIYITSDGRATISPDGSIAGPLAPPMHLGQVKSLEDLQRWGAQTRQQMQSLGQEIGRGLEDLERNYQVFTRGMGAVQTVGGAAEAFVGGVCIYGSAGLGALVGCGFLTLHGADSMQAGARTAWTGTSVPTYWYQGVNNAAQYYGASEQASHWIATGADAAPGLLSPRAAAQIGRGIQLADDIPAPSVPPRAPPRAPSTSAPKSPPAAPKGAGKGAAGANGAKVGPKPPSQVFDEADVLPEQKWNKETFRADNRTPEQMREAGGFQGTDPNARISALDHMYENRPPSQWVSTSQRLDVAGGYAEQNLVRNGFRPTYIYHLDAPGGVNLNAIGIPNASNFEVAFSRGIPWSSVTGYTTVTFDRATGQVVRVFTSVRP